MHYYYINKNKVKKKYLKNFFIPKIYNNNNLNNKNPEELNQKKTLNVEHFRYYNNYSFCSWTGFFCFNKLPEFENSEFFSLGYGIYSYFKTLKLLILFFFIIFCINIISIIHFSKYNNTNFSNNILIKTTLSNTKITKYNAILIYFNISNLCNTENIIFNCSNNEITGKFIYGLKNNKLKVMYMKV